MKGFKNTWVEGVHYDVIPQSEISKINKKISEDSTLNVNYKPERMYSAEDMEEAFTNGLNRSFDSDFDRWIEQFKK